MTKLCKENPEPTDILSRARMPEILSEIKIYLQQHLYTYVKKKLFQTGQ